MDDVAFVEVVQAEQDLAHPVADEWLLERAVVAQEGRNGTTGNVLQEDIQVIVVDA